jgi:arsenate reductase (glutaredoxin)
LKPADVLRVKEPIYASLALAERDISDDELIGLMAEHPELLQRPIVERGDRALLARPVDLLDLLD